MGFINKLIGGENDYHAASVTQGQKVTEQNLLPAIAQGQGNYTDVNSNQSELARQLLAQANGEGPSLAQQQLKDATNRIIQQQSGATGSVRGMSPALAQRLIAQQGANIEQQAAGQSAQARLQEQMAKQGAVAGIYGQQASEANNNLGVNQTAQASQNANITGANTASNTANAQIAQNNANANAKIGGSIINSGAAALGMAEGGPVPKPQLISTADTPQIAIDPALASGSGATIDFANKKKPQPTENEKAIAALPTLPPAPELGAPLPPPLPTDGNLMMPTKLLAKGGHVKGHPLVPGDSPKNDIVPAMLSPGEIVVPRSIAQSKDAPDKAKEFIKALQEEKQPGPKGFARVLDAKRRVQEAMEYLSAAHEVLNKK